MCRRRPNQIAPGKIISVILLLSVCWYGMPIATHADEDGEHSRVAVDSKRLEPEVTPIGLYRSLISKADGDRCPMYPSCSHYASEAFTQKGLLMGWILTCDRLLRCGRDETRLAPKVRIRGKVRTLDPLSANTFWWDTP